MGIFFNLFRGLRQVFKPDVHDLEALNYGSELGFFEFKNVLIWMERSSRIFPRAQHRSYFCPHLGINLVS